MAAAKSLVCNALLDSPPTPCTTLGPLSELRAGALLSHFYLAQPFFSLLHKTLLGVELSQAKQVSCQQEKERRLPSQ